MKKTISMILCLVLCIGLLAGCGSKTETPPSTEAPAEEKTGIGDTNTGGSSTADSIATPPPAEAEYYDDMSAYIYNKVALVDPLNPGAGTAQSGVLGNMLYDTLVINTIDGKFVPGLATEWSSEDNQHFNFKLREGVKFHNGETFTAKDVAFTIDRAKEAPGTHIYDRFNQIESYEIVSDYEINLNLKAVNIDFIYEASTPMCGILSEKAYADDPEHGGWVGTGPFRLVSFNPNDSLHYEANEDYWGDKPMCKTFTMRYIAEEAARLIMLENDEFTFCQVSNVYIPQYEQDPRFVISSYVMDNCNYVAFNMRKPITSDKNFRLAVAYALDRQAVADIALGGYAKIVDSGSFWGNKTAYKAMDLPLLEQDLEKAKACLKDSSYNGELIQITAGLPQTIAAAQVVMAQMQAVGINCEVRELDSPSMAVAASWENNDCDMIVNSGSWTPLASSCKAYFNPGSNTNKACYENPEVVDLIDQASATPDGPEREALYHKAQELIYDDMPYLGLYHPALYIAGQKGTGGVLFYPTGHIDYSCAYRLKNVD